ncbi:hypothetical protein BY996DRAFT_6459497 [Phakopsora pachyrhizi]|nr:hypothetical protein BY996DRAFT_6459497 [Phakopsora pachyrhizi]
MWQQIGRTRQASQSQTSRSIKQPKQRWTYGTTVGSSNNKQNTHKVDKRQCQEGKVKAQSRSDKTKLLCKQNINSINENLHRITNIAIRNQHLVLIRRIIGISNTRTADTFPSVVVSVVVGVNQEQKGPSRDITGFSHKNRTGPMGRGSKKTSAKNLALDLDKKKKKPHLGPAMEIIGRRKQSS